MSVKRKAFQLEILQGRHRRFTKLLLLFSMLQDGTLAELMQDAREAGNEKLLSELLQIRQRSYSTPNTPPSSVKSDQVGAVC